MAKRRYFSVIIMTLILWPLTASASAEDFSDVPDLDKKAKLVATAVDGPEVAEQKTNIDVIVTVENKGNIPSGSYKVSLYLTRDKIVSPAGNDRLLGEEYYKEGLEPGESKDVSVKVVVPNSGLEGKYYYGVRVKPFSVEFSDAISLKKVLLTRFTKTQDGLVVTDHKTGLTWQRSDDGIPRNWSQAETYCRDLNLGGYTGWRLPNLKELLGIWGSVKLDRLKTGSLVINQIFNCKRSTYWSYTAVDEGMKNLKAMWVIFVANYRLGNNGAAMKDFNNLTRCVRGRP